MGDENSQCVEVLATIGWLLLKEISWLE